MIIDKRCSVRKLLYLNVDVFSVGEHLGRYCSTNINLDGAFIESYPARVCAGDILDLHLYIEDSNRDSLRLKATVIHKADVGMGVQFDYGYSEYRRLLNTISTYTNDGQALNIPGFWYVGSQRDLTL